MTDPTYRFRGAEPPTAASRASILVPSVEGADAELWIYDPIDSWGGEWGVSAKEVGVALSLVPDDVTTINLRINSPGGEVWDAMAIANLLRRHKARIVAHVDGIAASAASVIAVTCDEVVMGVGSQMMIHDAWMVTIGDAASLAAAAEQLDKDSLALAGLYAKKAGGTAEEWRAAMTAGARRETWYSAEEAVAAGLADRVVESAATKTVEARAKAMLAAMPGIQYRGGRAEAPAPVIRPHVSATPQPPEATEPPGLTTAPEGDDMSTLTDGLRTRLGITDAELDEAGLLAALDEALQERSEATAINPPAGTVLVDQDALAALRADAAAGREARNRQEAEDRVAAVDAAINEGRILASRRDAWLANLEQDPGAAATLASLPQIIPTVAIGSAGGVEVDADDEMYATIFGRKEA